MKSVPLLGAVVGALLIGVGGYVVGSMRPGATPPLSEAEQSSVHLAATEDQPITDLGAITQARSAANPWEYRSIRDPLTGRSGVMACTQSTQPVRLRYPYDSHTALLCVRSSPRYGDDVVLIFPRGAGLICDAACQVAVRVGAAEPVMLPASEPQDSGPPATLFIADAGVAQLIEGLKTAEDAALEVEIYQQGPQTISFRTANFRWPQENSAPTSTN